MRPETKPWDTALAEDIIGKLVLVGITRVDPAGAVKSQAEFFGYISSADASDGIALKLRGSQDGETYWLPPDLGELKPARPGTYKLHSTGEEVNDPDFTCSWTVHERADG